MKTIFLNIILSIFVVAVFDLASYWLIPENYVTTFKSYRKDSNPTKLRTEGWPINYHIAHKERGFDIGKTKSARHVVGGLVYPVWSNSVGCFDKEHPDLSNYVYFAGDSFTWGYAPFEDKFGTLMEQSSGISILKCGVTHTGQRHQFSKFVSIVKQISILPKAIFVFHFENDVANDYAHPTSTVIDGRLIDTVSINQENKLFRHPMKELIAQNRIGTRRLRRPKRMLTGNGDDLKSRRSDSQSQRIC
jgi:hypothetical protein